VTTTGRYLTFVFCSGSIALAQSARDLTDLSLEQLLQVKVTAASLHEQSPKDAPASVTVITAEEIRTFGYRTLAEALTYVPGLYVTSDHTVAYVGLRGFSLPDDFGTRLIVMINGHSIADNMFDESAWFQNDFPVDIDLVDRIEIVRGPSSALYGSNGMLATINVVTKRPSDAAAVSARMETGSLGERKAEISAAANLGKGANLLVSASVINDAGAGTLYFPQFDAAATNFGRAINMDGMKGYHAFADFTWGNWEILAVTGDRVQIQPLSWGPTVFNDRGSRAEDSRGFVEASYKRQLPGDRTLTWSASYDEYRYRGIYRYASDEGIIDNRERDYGDWVGSKLNYRFPNLGGYLTAGVDVRFDVRAMQDVFNVQPAPLPILKMNPLDRFAGAFLQQEWTFGPHWELDLGGRYDWAYLKRSSVSPRAALIYKPSSKTDFKFLYGRGFRNPSNFEMFFANGFGQIANPNLLPETTNTFEVEADHDFTKRIRASVSGYRYDVGNLIEQEYTEAGLQQFQNADRIVASGVSVEVDALLGQGIEIRSSLTLERAADNSGLPLPNSPGQIGKLQISFPVLRDFLKLGASVQGIGDRSTYTGQSLGWMILPEVSVSTRRLAGGFGLGGGIKNLSNTYYQMPAALAGVVDSIAGAGRTFYLSATWSSPDARPDARDDTAKGAPRASVR
jgi:outer membrane receptor protein involved in Fe transport